MTPGTTIASRYRIVGEIARGAMGAIYEAYDHDLGRDVAIKRLLKTGPKQTERLRREALALARVQHPNVIHLYDVLEYEGALCLVMRFVRGESLDKRLQRGRIPVPEVTRIAQHLAEALQASHEAGVLHRDIKPANVLLDVDGNPLLIDYGLARGQNESGRIGSATHGQDISLTNTGDLLGTPHYMSPERLRQKPADESGDLYALGATLYELLTGHPPYPAETFMELAGMHAEGPPPAPSSIRPGLAPKLDTICLQLLSSKPESRPRSAAEVAVSLSRVRGRMHAPVAAAADPEPRAPLPLASVGVIAAGLVLAALGASGVYFTIQETEPYSQTVSGDEPLAARRVSSGETGLPSRDESGPSEPKEVRPPRVAPQLDTAAVASQVPSSHFEARVSNETNRGRVEFSGGDHGFPEGTVLQVEVSVKASDVPGQATSLFLARVETGQFTVAKLLSAPFPPLAYTVKLTFSVEDQTAEVRKALEQSRDGLAPRGSELAQLEVALGNEHERDAFRRSSLTRLLARLEAFSALLDGIDPAVFLLSEPATWEALVPQLRGLSNKVRQHQRGFALHPDLDLLDLLASGLLELSALVQQLQDGDGLAGAEAKHGDLRRLADLLVLRARERVAAYDRGPRRDVAHATPERPPPVLAPERPPVAPADQSPPASQEPREAPAPPSETPAPNRLLDDGSGDSEEFPELAEQDSAWWSRALRISLLRADSKYPDKKAIRAVRLALRDAHSVNRALALRRLIEWPVERLRIAGSKGLFDALVDLAASEGGQSEVRATCLSLLSRLAEEPPVVGTPQAWQGWWEDSGRSYYRAALASETPSSFSQDGEGTFAQSLSALGTFDLTQRARVVTKRGVDCLVLVDDDAFPRGGELAARFARVLATLAGAKVRVGFCAYGEAGIARVPLKNPTRLIASLKRTKLSGGATDVSVALSWIKRAGWRSSRTRHVLWVAGARTHPEIAGKNYAISRVYAPHRKGQNAPMWQALAAVFSGGLRLDENYREIVDVLGELELVEPTAGNLKHRGYAKLQRGDYKDAIEDFDRALDLGLSTTDAAETRRWRAQAASKAGPTFKPKGWKPSPPRRPSGPPPPAPRPR